MVNLMSGGALEAGAWKIRNLEDYERRLEAAARRVDELDRERETAGLVILEAALAKSGRPADEVRALVRRFEEAFADEEDELTIPRVSGILNVEGDSWFFGDAALRTMTGQLLGQFQHRVTQYNYVSEREVLRRWANSYDTRLFIRRRIHETEPIVGVVEGADLGLIQTLRVAAGGDTVVPNPSLARALTALGVLDEGGDEYAVLAAAEGLALRLELPAPIVGEMLDRLVADDRLEFPEPPPETTEEPAEEGSEEATDAEETAAGETELAPPKPGPEDRAARRAAREEARRGDEPTRVQDPQAKDAPGTREEAGKKPEPSPPQAGTGDAPGKEG